MSTMAVLNMALELCSIHLLESEYENVDTCATTRDE
jgi:hypothetical protein